MLSKLSKSRRTHYLSTPIIMGFLLFSNPAGAEEKYVWGEAKVTSSHGTWNPSSPLDNLIHGTSFKDIVHTNDGSAANQYLMIDQGEPLKIERIYIQNRSEGWRYRFGNLHVCIGNVSSSSTALGNTCTTVPIHEGGFITVDLPAGRYVFLDRRDKADYFNLSTALAFQTPNLLEPGFDAIIIADYTAESGYEKENLNSNLGIRTMRYDVEPTIDASGNTTTAFKSCFKILTAQIAPADPFVMTVDLRKEIVVNSVLLVQDVLYGYISQVSAADLDKYHATQIDVHIGSDSNGRNNPKCTSIPLLSADYKDSISFGVEVVNHGIFTFCNMQGQFVTFVIHGVPSESITLCNLAISGNSYIRDISPVTTVEIPAGETHTMQVEHIRPESPQGNDVAINLRQKDGEELPFVSFNNGASSTDVIIDTADLSPGEYTLVLESFDEASNGVESTLKTDTITIVITEPGPTFTQSLAPASIISGTVSQWTLPEIDLGNAILTEVRLDADPLIQQHLKYDGVANSVIYDGKEIGALTAMKLVKLNITFVNSVGENLYTQMLIVSPNYDILLPYEPEVVEDNASEVEDKNSNSTQETTRPKAQQENQEKEQIPSATSPPKIEQDQAIGDYYAAMIRASVLAREQAAAEAGLDAIEIPKAELASISKDGEVVIKFSKDIQFPADLLQTFNSSTQTATPASEKIEDRKMEDEQEEPITAQSLFTVRMMSSETEVVSENLTSWRVTSMTPKEIKIALTFAQPLEVSQGDEHDVLSVFAGLGEYKDKDEINLPSFELLMEELPPQNPSGGVVEIVTAAGVTTSTATASVIGANFVMNLLFTGSLKSLWSLLNSEQVIVHAPMFQNLKFPNNASALNEQFVKVVSLDIIDTPGWIDHYMIDLGDDGEPFSYNFEQCGFETTWFLANSSFIVWTWVINTALFVLYFLVRELSIRTGKLQSVRSKMHNYLFFNGPLRLYMETFLDLYLSSLLNVWTAVNETEN